MGTNTVAIGVVRDMEAAKTTETAMTELMNWEKVVALVQEKFGEGRLA